MQVVGSEFVDQGEIGSVWVFSGLWRGDGEAGVVPGKLWAGKALKRLRKELAWSIHRAEARC